MLFFLNCLVKDKKMVKNSKKGLLMKLVILGIIVCVGLILFASAKQPTQQQVEKEIPVVL